MKKNKKNDKLIINNILFLLIFTKLFYNKKRLNIH
jgi:hypothetical protein